jgi:hypothetical protein
MYSTEYDLMIAEDRFRELEAQMREINMARAIQARKGGSPSLLGRLVALIGRGTHTAMPHGKVGAAA